MKFLLRFLPAFWIAAAQTPAPSEDVFAEVDQIFRELTRISGMEARRKVACEVINREKVNAFLNQRVKEVATPEEIRAEELTLKKFGLVPPDFDLAKSTVDLLTEQAAAFYDFTRKRLYITETAASAGRDAALVHELAHALADQNFDLDRFLKQARKSDDAALARMAVMEGQATWLMSEYLAQKMGQSLKTSPELAAMMSRSAESAAGQYPVFDTAPLYMRATLIFPYSEGMRFQQAVVQRDGPAAFAEIFRRPPVSTRQISHPQAYFENAAPARPGLPAFTARGFKEVADGSFGELDHRILIEQYVGKDEAAAIAPRWRGGRYRLYEDRGRRRTVLAYASEWDSAESAASFFGFYKRVLERKWKQMDVTADSGTRVEGTGDDGRFVLERQGATVTSLEGAEPRSERTIHWKNEKNLGDPGNCVLAGCVLAEGCRSSTPFARVLDRAQ